MATTTLTAERAAEQAEALRAAGFGGDDDFADKADAARNRLREPRQLSFDLGASRAGEPDYATLKITGQFPVTRDLLYKESVIVAVTDARTGEVICSGPATVGWPSFKDKALGDLTFTERVHTAALD